MIPHIYNAITRSDNMIYYISNIDLCAITTASLFTFDMLNKKMRIRHCMG